MNGPATMYRCKQIINHNEPIELPKCVYKMKNILTTDFSIMDDEDPKVTGSKNLDISQQVLKFLKVLLLTHFIY